MWRIVGSLSAACALSMSIALGISDAAPGHTPSPYLSQADGPISAEVVWFWGNEGARVFRAVVVLTNTDTQDREGIVTRWEAYDPTGALVGGRTQAQPRLQAGQSWTYVAGAGSLLLSGTPARATVTVVDHGRVVHTPDDVAQIEDIQVTREPVSIHGRGHTDYTVSARVTTSHIPTPRENFGVNVVLRDTAIAIVGAGFATIPRTLPDVLPPATAIRVETRVTVPSGTPAGVEMTAYRRP